jgi:hypothetical protein
MASSGVLNGGSIGPHFTRSNSSQPFNFAVRPIFLVDFRKFFRIFTDMFRWEKFCDICHCQFTADMARPAEEPLSFQTHSIISEDIESIPSYSRLFSVLLKKRHHYYLR